jgi:hypothetical protein
MTLDELVRVEQLLRRIIAKDALDHVEVAAVIRILVEDNRTLATQMVDLLDHIEWQGPRPAVFNN